MDLAETAVCRAVLMRQSCPQRGLLRIDHRGVCHGLAALFPCRGGGGREEGHDGLERRTDRQTPE